MRQWAGWPGDLFFYFSAYAICHYQPFFVIGISPMHHFCFAIVIEVPQYPGRLKLRPLFGILLRRLPLPQLPAAVIKYMGREIALQYQEISFSIAVYIAKFYIAGGWY